MVTSQYLFPQQIAYDDIENFEDIQDSLVEWMYHYQKYNNNAKVSNKGGWQSESKEIFLDQGFKMFERSPLATSMEADFDTGNMRFKARERYSFGFSDPRCVFGSPGA